jgi:hypothetical protein
MTMTIRQVGLASVLALVAAACSSKDSLLSVYDGAVDPSTPGTGGALLGTGGAGGSLGGAGGSTNRGSGGSATGTGGVIPGTGGSGSGGSVTGIGGSGFGGALQGSGGIGTGGLLTGTGGGAGIVTGTGGSGRGGNGSGGTVSTGGNNGGVTGRGGTSGQGGTGQDGAVWYDAGADASDVNPPDCPSSVPSGSCSLSSSTICYYGEDTRWFCKTSAKCSQATWQVTLPLQGCTAAPDPSCPAEPTSPPAGICSTDGGTKATCVYSTGFCRCGFTGGPEPGWVCSKTLPAECPVLRPGDGSTCTVTSGVWCTYGPACSGSDMQCIEGKWVTLLLSC